MSDSEEPRTERTNDSYTGATVMMQTMDVLVDRDARYACEDENVAWAVAEVARVSGTEALKA